jgi:hypothetical protein
MGIIKRLKNLNAARKRNAEIRAAPKEIRGILKDGATNARALDIAAEKQSRGIYTGGLPEVTKKLTRKHADMRENRASVVAFTAMAPPIFLTGFLHANRLAESPNFVAAVTNLIILGAPIAPLFAGIAIGPHLLAKRGVKKHFATVETALVKETKTNENFGKFLNSELKKGRNYILIDKKGNVKARKRKPIRWGYIAVDIKGLLETAAK